MKEMSLEEQKEVQLSAMQIIHEFCTKNNIRYSLSGGSLLGAVRHKGYIPWDDDIDVMMPRSDYNRFLKEFGGYCDHLEIFNSYTTNTCVNAFSKVIDNRTLVGNDSKKGVFIDVFPIDGAYKYVQKILRVIGWCWNLLEYYVPNSPRRTLISNILTKIVPRKWVINFREYLYCIKPLEKAEKGGVLSGQYGNKEIMDAKTFKSFVMFPFEGYNFYCIEGYDTYLSSLYGNYMELPPEDKRVSPHQFKSYWK